MKKQPTEEQKAKAAARRANGAEVNADGERPGFIMGTVFDVSQTDAIKDAADSGRECLAELETVNA